MHPSFAGSTYDGKVTGVARGPEPKFAPLKPKAKASEVDPSLVKTDSSLVKTDSSLVKTVHKPATTEKKKEKAVPKHKKSVSSSETETKEKPKATKAAKDVEPKESKELVVVKKKKKVSDEEWEKRYNDQKAMVDANRPQRQSRLEAIFSKYTNGKVKTWDDIDVDVKKYDFMVGVEPEPEPEPVISEAELAEDLKEEAEDDTGHVIELGDQDSDVDDGEGDDGEHDGDDSKESRSAMDYTDV